jgi:diaminopimelate epimerase
MLVKSHGLGNDYLVADPADLPFSLSPERLRLLCDRHFGVGSDGLLLWQPPLGLRIFNPDGSEAEKSGNGLRIFAKWLFDTRRTTETRFAIALPEAFAEVEVTAVGDTGRAQSITVDMGRPTFRGDLPSLDVAGEHLDVVALSIGNPHCVVFRDTLDVTELRRLGPAIEAHPAFANRTNVQLARALDRHTVELLIWERGAGETHASGSSSCAVVAAAHHQGRIDADQDVTARMPGGELRIRIDDASRLWLSGPVEEIASITLSPDLIARLQALP